MLAGLILTVIVSAAPARTEPCRSNSRPANEAHRELLSLDRRIERAESEEELRDAKKALQTLMQHRCFVGTRESPRPFQDASRLEFKTWWRNGGRPWLGSYLSMTDSPPRRERREVLVPPDVRKELRVPAGHPLQSLLCSGEATDAGCALGDGWRKKMGRALEQAHADDQRRDRAVEVRENCDARLQLADPGERYTQWRACIEGGRTLQPALPLGRWRIPTSGWLVSRGRRGHYEFCDELRVYSLTSGAAYISSSCAALLLTNADAVDGGEVDRPRPHASVRVGTLPVAEVRSAALALLMIPYVEERVQIAAEIHSLPDDVTPSWDQQAWLDSGWSGGSWAHSGQTELSWMFRAANGTAARDRLTWPDSSNIAESVAAEWLRAAESKFAEGCPPEALPPDLEVEVPRVNRLDAPGGVAAVQDERMKALLGWKAPPHCERAR